MTRTWPCAADSTANRGFLGLCAYVPHRLSDGTSPVTLFLSPEAGPSNVFWSICSRWDPCRTPRQLRVSPPRQGILLSGSGDIRGRAGKFGLHTNMLVREIQRIRRTTTLSSETLRHA